MTEESVLLASASYEERILLWDIKKGKPVRTLAHEGSQVNSMRISPDRKKLACAGNPQIRIYDLESQNKSPYLRLTGHHGNVVDVEYERKMRFLVSASEDSTVKLWDIRVKGAQRDYHLKSEVNAMTLHPNQAEILCASHDGQLKVIDLVANKVINYLPTVEQGDQDVHLRSIAVSPAGDWLTFSADTGDLFVWKMDKLSAVALDPAAMKRIPAHNATILRSRFSPDGSILATASADGLIMLWDAKTWTEIKTLDGHREWVWDIAFASDAKYLISGGSDMSVILWDIQAGLAAKKFQGHQRAVSAIAFNDNVAVSSLQSSNSSKMSGSSAATPTNSLPGTPSISVASLPSVGSVADIAPPVTSVLQNALASSGSQGPPSGQTSGTATPVSSEGQPQPPTGAEIEAGLKKSVSSKKIVVKKIVVDKNNL